MFISLDAMKQNCQHAKGHGFHNMPLQGHIKRHTGAMLQPNMQAVCTHWHLMGQLYVGLPALPHGSLVQNTVPHIHHMHRYNSPAPSAAS